MTFKTKQKTSVSVKLQIWTMHATSTGTKLSQELKSTTGFYHSACRIYCHGHANAQSVHITSFTNAEWKSV